jgi:hypothetical protein
LLKCKDFGILIVTYGVKLRYSAKNDPHYSLTNH